MKSFIRVVAAFCAALPRRPALRASANRSDSGAKAIAAASRHDSASRSVVAGWAVLAASKRPHSPDSRAAQIHDVQCHGISIAPGARRPVVLHGAPLRHDPFIGVRARDDLAKLLGSCNDGSKLASNSRSFVGANPSFPSGRANP
jgi:hypothetical protein